MDSMVSQDAQRMVRTYESIIDVARSITSLCGGHKGSTSRLISPPPHPPDADYRLPTPPSIDTALLKYRLSSDDIAKLSRAYQKRARQLKRSAEARLQRTIHACSQVTTSLDSPSFNSRLVYLAVAKFYERTLRELADLAFGLCQRHAQSVVYSTQLPKHVVISIHDQSLPQISVASLQPHKRSGSNSVVEAFLPSSHSPLRSQEVTMSTSLRLTDSSASNIVPVYKSQGDACETVVVASHGLPTAYPAKYTHGQAHSSPRFASSHQDFFPDLQVKTGCISRFRSDTAPTSIPSMFDALTLGDRKAPRVGRYQSAQSGVSVASPSDPGRQSSTPSVDSRASGSNHNSTRQSSISLDSITPLSFKRSTRAMLPIPRHNPMQTDCPATTSLKIPSLASPHPSQTSSTVSLSVTPSIPPGEFCRSDKISESSREAPRRRKVVSLPRRRPINTPSNFDLAPQHPTSSSFGFSPSQYQSGSLHTISRTPSLVSLASSRAGSPSSEDRLDTPPSSPLTLSPVNELFPKAQHLELVPIRPVMVKEEESFRFSFSL